MRRDYYQSRVGYKKSTAKIEDFEIIRISICPSVRPSVCPYVCPSFPLHVCLSVRPSFCLHVCPSLSLAFFPSFCLSVSQCISSYSVSQSLSRSDGSFVCFVTLCPLVCPCGHPIFLLSTIKANSGT